MFVCLLPHGSFGYRAIDQGAQTSVQTSHPMAVHCLLHAVDCSRLKRCSSSVIDLINVCVCAKRSFLYFHSQQCVLLVGPRMARADKHSPCQSSQALGKNLAKKKKKRTGSTKQQQQNRFAQVCTKVRLNRLSGKEGNRTAGNPFFWNLK